MIHNEQEYRTMLELEQKLWWYRILYHKIKTVLKGESRALHLLDIGCGTGGVIAFLQEHGFQQVKGIDVSPYSIKVCQERGLPAESADALTYLSQLQDQQLHVILFMDSLTYIEEHLHKKVMQECYRVLKPGGKIILNSAALEAFRGIHDEHVGTLCRLDKKRYREYAHHVGFQISHMHYWPFLLGVPIYLIRTWQRYKIKTGKTVELKTDLEMPPVWLNEAYYAITRMEEYFSRLALFGSSVFAVFTKPL